jgi:NAD(P)-dependent dehydrogenase (short-subunit alcohol dehydrogenase family)
MDRTVLISGTSSGIGAACVARLARAGWRVYAGVRREEDGERLASAIAADVVPVILDVTRAQDIAAVLDRIRAERGKLHGLVNNAGIGVGGPVELLTVDEWRRQFDVNLFGLLALTREAMPLVERADGRFVHIGSIAGRVAMAGLGPYSASKHALEAVNWALRAELAPATRMTSSLVEPGDVRTAIWGKAAANVDVLEDVLRSRGLTGRYGFVVDQLRGFAAEGEAKGVAPDAVAQAVERALTARRPRARYTVGRDAAVVGLMTLLPDRLRELAEAANARRLGRIGRALRR